MKLVAVDDDPLYLELKQPSELCEPFIVITFPDQFCWDKSGEHTYTRPEYTNYRGQERKKILTHSSSTILQSFDIKNGFQRENRQ